MADFDEGERASEDSASSLESPETPQIESESAAVNVDDALALAASMKEQGNDLFKGGDLSGARSSYEGALDALKALTETSQKEDKVRIVMVALYGNVCMCAVKSEDWPASIEAASEAIKRQSDNVKSLYRRGLSYHKLKSYDKAKKDLTACLQVDPANGPAKKELGLVERAIATSEKKSAAALKAAYAGNMFGGSDKGLYDDREKARAAKKRREENEENRLRDEWTKSKLDRRNQGLAEQTFEEYKDELKKQKEEEEKEREKKRKAERDAKTASSPLPAKVAPTRKPSAKPAADSDDEDDEDDEDLKGLIKGYKKTSDGRTTSFFNNEMDEATKALLGDIGPKALDSGAVSDPSSPTPLASPGPNGATGTAPSAWNSAGTFESRNMTDWSTTHVRTLLENASFTLPSDPSGNPPALYGSVVVTVKECKNVKGEAEIIISRGKKKVIYDYSAELSFEMAMDTSSATLTEKSFKGKVTLTDITGDDDPDVAYTFKKAPSAEYKTRAAKAMEGLVDRAKCLCQAFKEDLLRQ